MKSAIAVLEGDVVKVYQSDDRSKLEKEVIRAKEKGYPYAVLVPCDDTTV